MQKIEQERKIQAAAAAIIDYKKALVSLKSKIKFLSRFPRT